MEECKPVLNTGLRGVVIADTRICDVDGANGRLIYRGDLIQDLAKRATFEEVTYLLLYEKLPDNAELKEFRRRLREQQGLPTAVIAALKTMPKDALPMDVLQCAVPMLAQHDEDVIKRDQSIIILIRVIIGLCSITMLYFIAKAVEGMAEQFQHNLIWITTLINFLAYFTIALFAAFIIPWVFTKIEKQFLNT